MRRRYRETGETMGNNGKHCQLIDIDIVFKNLQNQGGKHWKHWSHHLDGYARNTYHPSNFQQNERRQEWVTVDSAELQAFVK